MTDCRPNPDASLCLHLFLPFVVVTTVQFRHFLARFSSACLTSRCCWEPAQVCSWQLKCDAETALTVENSVWDLSSLFKTQTRTPRKQQQCNKGGRGSATNHAGATTEGEVEWFPKQGDCDACHVFGKNLIIQEDNNGENLHLHKRKTVKLCWENWRLDLVV